MPRLLWHRTGDRVVPPGCLVAVERSPQPFILCTRCGTARPPTTSPRRRSPPATATGSRSPAAKSTDWSVYTDGRRNESPQALAIAVGLVPAIPGNGSLTGDRPTITDFVSTWHAQRGELNGTALGNHRVARGLTWPDIHFDAMEVHVQWQLQRAGHKLRQGNSVLPGQRPTYGYDHRV